MRAVELAKVAASAEALRLRRIARRQIFRAVYAVVAAVFVVALLVMLHVVLYQALTRWVPPWASSLIVLAVDLAVAAVFGVLALSNAPDAVEEEAKLIRQQAVVEMRKSLGVVAVAGEVAGLALGSNRVRRGLLSGIAGRFLARR